MLQSNLTEIEINGTLYIKLDAFDLWQQNLNKIIFTMNKEKWDVIKQLEMLRKEHVRYKRLMRRQIKRWEKEHNIVLDKGFDI